MAIYGAVTVEELKKNKTLSDGTPLFCQCEDVCSPTSQL